MRLKPRHKRRIIWTIVSNIGAVLFAAIVLPPMITLNYLKPKIENIILTQTGVKAQIHGNINFSLLGKTTIIAHNISVPNGVISSCEFAIPLRNIFDIDKATISGDIIVNGASLSVEKIVPFDMKTNVFVKNSKMTFLNKEYKIVSADLSKMRTDAIVQTDQHKYKITSIKNKFEIKNKDNSLSISGTLFPNGTVTARLDITAQDINRWFEFEKPKITGRFPITADVTWDGGYGIKFLNISANGISGDIILQPNGYKTIKLSSTNADYDMSFVIKDSEIFKNAAFDLDFYGKIKFLDKTFNHLSVNTVGLDNEIKINKIIANDITIQGGSIDAHGAHNVFVSLPENNVETKCLFNGTPNDWYCEKFAYGDKITGTLKVQRNRFYANIQSSYPINDINAIVKATKKFGDSGIIDFEFQNTSGRINVINDKISIKYNFMRNKNLQWAKIDLPFLPNYMMSETGNFVWNKNIMIFVPKSQNWNLSIEDGHFYITGNNFKTWFENLDLQSLQTLPYVISGNYKQGNISDLKIQIANHEFTGSASGKSITLKTNTLNLDAFLSKQFLDNFESLSFFTNAPLMILFDLDNNVSLSADALIYKNQKYNNFVYSLKPNTQTFSITDSNRGNLLAKITKNKTKYTIDIKLNKFKFDGKILSNNMPLNLADSTVTAEINLKTSGKIAHDIFANIHGTFDASFDGGVFYGFGFDKFYANAKYLNILNAEYALSNALESGTSQMKQMRIIGEYNMGDIKTIKPLTLSLRHTDVTGNFEITDNKMSAKLNLVLRGTSPSTAPIDLIIKNNGHREYSLGEIMKSFDADYMQSFVKNHSKF
jgi:hypothetical protein